MSHNRNLKYLNDRRIVYRRHPISDIPDQENEVYMFYLNVLEIMNKELKLRIKQFNDIKYGNDNNETRIIITTLKPQGTVTTAPKIKE